MERGERRGEAGTPPPLHAAGDAAPPAGGEAFWLTASDGRRLRAAYWPSLQPRPRGAVALFQGRTEFIEKFYEPIARFRAMGFSVLTLDWRGQGLSDRPRFDRRAGHVGDFAEYQRDVDAALTALAQRAPQGPWVLAAHSMGGAIAARTLMRQAAGGATRPPGPGFAAAILSAPMLGLSGAGGGALARVAANALTGLGRGRAYTPGGSPTPLSEQGFDGNPLTSDPTRFERVYAAFIRQHPDLALGGATWAWLRAARREMAALRPVDLPLLVAVGDAEEVVSPSAARAYAELAPQGELLRLEGGARHEPFLETDAIQQTLWTGIERFLDRWVPREG